MNRSQVLPLLFVLAWALQGMTQEPCKGSVLAIGSQIDRASVVGPQKGLVILQNGSTLFCLRNSGRPEIVASFELPPQTFLWDFLENSGQQTSYGEIFAQTATGVQSARIPKDGEGVTFTKVSAPGDLFRGRLSAAPVARKFVWRLGKVAYWVVPTLTGLRTFERNEDGQVKDCGLNLGRLTSEQSLGYGLGYRMKARVTVPYFTLDILDKNRPALLFRQDKNYAYRSLPSGAPKPWGKAPLSENNEVVKFEHRIPPLSLDYDDDGLIDLIHVDPGTGTTLVYQGRKREIGRGKKPDRVFRITGHVLWRWLEDGDGDGKKDLFLLELSKLNVLAQVKVMQKRSLPVVLSMRRQITRGRFEVSALWSDRFDLPCEISMTRNVKRVQFRAPIKLISNPKDGKLLLLAPEEKGKVAVYGRGEDGWEVQQYVPSAYTEKGFHVRPFDTQLWQGSKKSSPELLILIKNPQADKDRVLTLPIFGIG